MLGCVLEHATAEGLVAVRLTEVEAYAGSRDPASHAYRGRTPRNAVMYGPPGHAYVYFTYGMHFCVNIVCQLPGDASAVLLRAGEIIKGEPLASKRRIRPGPDSGPDSGPRPAIPPRDLARGPARLCVALAITRDQNGADLCDPGSPVRVLPAPTRGVPAHESGTGQGEQPPIAVGPRVGVSTAADIKWRFWLGGDPTVSVYRAHQRRTGTPTAS